MPGLRDGREVPVAEGVGVAAAVLGREQAIFLAPGDKDRHGDAVQATAQLRGEEEVLAAVDGHGLLVGCRDGALLVGHRGRVGPQRLVVERQLPDLGRRQGADVGDLVTAVGSDADRIDQHHRLDPAVDVAQRDLGGDPAANGVPDHHHRVQLELGQQVEIGVGQVIH